MAGVATATGIGIGGIAAIGGLALSAIGMGASFGQASQQRKAEEAAKRQAERAMAEARKKLEVNYLDALAIQKEPYELEREALLVAGAQGVEAARESERGAAAGVGRIQLAQQKGQQAIRTAMGREMTALDRAAAAEESRLRDVGVQLDLGEVAGAQMAASDASQAAAAAQTQGFQQLASFGAQALQAAPLFSKSAGVRDFNQGQRQAVRQARRDSGKGFLGIGTGVDKQAVQNKFMLDTLTGENSGFNVDRFVKLAGKQGLGSFDEKQFLANPQSYINRGSVEQQSYLNNILYGSSMNVGGPIEDEVIIEEIKRKRSGDPMSSMYGFY
jgi:hypothetical protein